MSHVDPGGLYPRPSLQPCIDALRVTDPKFPWVKPTFDEENIAVVVEAVHEQHRSDAEKPDNDEWLSPWGVCASCDEAWPCPSWADANRLGQRWVGIAHQRYADRVAAVMKTKQGRTA